MSMKRKLTKTNRALSFLLVVCLFVTSFWRITIPVSSEYFDSGSVTSVSDSKTEAVMSETEAVLIESMSVEEIASLRIKLNSELLTSKIFDYVDESQFKAANHVSRLHDEETFNTYVFLNEDGSRTVYLLDENVKYVAENGTIQEKDLTLVQKETITSGDVSLMSVEKNYEKVIGTGVCDYTVKASDIGLVLPNDISKGIELTYGTKKIT